MMRRFRKEAAGFALVAIAGIAVSCNQTETADNPTRGTIGIAADVAFQPVISELTQAYEGIYPNTHFKVRYLPEQQAILALLQDSVRMAFVTRKLLEREEKMLLQQASTAKVHEIATDGIALIVSRSNTDTLITVPELERIFGGAISDWSELKKSRSAGKIDLVFDDANSSNLLYFKKRFNISDFKNLRIVIAGSSEKVIETVRNNPRSIGFIGVNWISDGKEAASVERFNGIHVMGVAAEADPADGSGYKKPFQRDLEEKKYPLARQLYAITREAHSGLGGGLLTYIARDVGGLIIMKMGLVPSVPYSRSVILKTE